ncbi:MAG: hypothetical protein ACJ788_19450 [Ktedonobacteraceae bacterium]
MEIRVENVKLFSERNQGDRKGMPLLYSARASHAAPSIVGATLAVALVGSGRLTAVVALALTSAPMVAAF